MNNQYFQAILQIIRTGHWITDQVSIELKEFDITEPQYNVLRILRGAKGEPLTVQRILESMVQRSSNVTRIVDKLKAKGYVQRKKCPRNRRKMDITITESGLEILKEMDEKLQAFHKPMMVNLNNEELETLKNLIIKLKSHNND
ncbi:MAG: MarR family transcriptional regulator [Chitinophagales bacterium]